MFPPPADYQTNAPANAEFVMEVPTPIVTLRREKDARVSEVLHDATTAGVCARLDQDFVRPHPPTGLVVLPSSHLLTVREWLRQAGRRVPQDVSALCREDELILNSVILNPSRYTLNPLSFARKISRAVVALVTGGRDPQRARLIPTFVRGKSWAMLQDS